MKIEIGFKDKRDTAPDHEWHRWFAFILAHRWHSEKVTFIIGEWVLRRKVGDIFEYHPI